MKQDAAVRICLSDLKGQIGFGQLFDLIEKCKAAIFAQDCLVKDIRFSNESNIDDPRGEIGTITFTVLSRDDIIRKLIVDHWLDNSTSRIFARVKFEPST